MRRYFTPTLVVLILFYALIFNITGCSSTRSRINDNSRQFNTFAPEVQAQIQNGRIDKGFTEDMVYMAKGKPNDVAKSVRDGKTVVVWKYAKSNPRYFPQNSTTQTGLNSPYAQPSFGPGPKHPTPMFYDKQFFKIEFIDGKVTDWDHQIQKD